MKYFKEIGKNEKEGVSKDGVPVIARAIARSNPLIINTLDCFTSFAMTKKMTF
ncbi:hypothetical protein [Dysgonomonas reticulitermitis]